VKFSILTKVCSSSHLPLASEGPRICPDFGPPTHNLDNHVLSWRHHLRRWSVPGVVYIDLHRIVGLPLYVLHQHSHQSILAHKPQLTSFSQGMALFSSLSSVSRPLSESFADVFLAVNHCSRSFSPRSSHPQPHQIRTRALKARSLNIRRIEVQMANRSRFRLSKTRSLRSAMEMIRAHGARANRAS
jgi:hypothetical protein